MLIRFIAYGALGWCVEILWTAVSGAVAEPRGRWRLQGVTYLWMFPIYGLLVVLYEPLHELIRHWPWPARAVLYATGFLAVEYATGWVLRRLVGVCPWDYTGKTRWELHGLMRLDYAPLWALLGLALEPVHDFLVRLTPFVAQVAGV